MKKISFCILPLILSAGLVSFGSINPSCAEISKLSTKTQEVITIKSKEKSSGEERYRSVAKAQIIKHKDKFFIYLEERGKWNAGRDKQSITWFASVYSSLDGTKITPYLIKVVKKNSQGKIISVVDKFYDRKNKIVMCNINGITKEFKFEDNMVDQQNLVVYLMNYPFEEKKDLNLQLLTNEPALHEITIKYKGTEKLTIENVEVECYKLEMIPNLGILNIFRIFIPKFYFWYETKPPHNFIKYEGLEDGLGTPYVVVEAQR